MLSNTKALLGHRGTCIHCHVQSILDLGEAYTTRQLNIGGKDLLALGYRGKEVGELLDFLLTSVINGDVKNERDALLSYIKKEICTP
jgi:tRNA nucleotidyltransferase (CCA-adding enzyme)